MSDLSVARFTLPLKIRGVSIHTNIIPTVCNLKNMLDKLDSVNGDYSQLKSWEKRSYLAYQMDKITLEILHAESTQRIEIIKQHILNGHPSDFGASCLDMYLVAYVAENFGAGKDAFFEYIGKSGITENENSAKAIWQVGKGDGVYLGILNQDGSIRDWRFFYHWVNGAKDDISEKQEAEQSLVVKFKDQYMIKRNNVSFPPKEIVRRPSNNLGITAQIRRYIISKLLAARDVGKETLDIISGDIHKEMGLSNSMPSVCNAMESLGDYEYTIINDTPSGKSSTKVIRYYLSRSEGEINGGILGEESLVRYEIEEITIPVEKGLLNRWKARDPKVVPEFALGWNGNGVGNGYGFGEWIAEKYFRSLGYYVIANEFDLFSKNSKYKRYNDIIANIIGEEKIEDFSQKARSIYNNGFKVENIDLFVFNTQSCFFVEVKKGNDKLREPQLRFMYLAKDILQTDCKMVYISEESEQSSSEIVTYEIT